MELISQWGETRFKGLQDATQAAQLQDSMAGTLSSPNLNHKGPNNGTHNPPPNLNDANEPHRFGGDSTRT